MQRNDSYSVGSETDRILLERHEALYDDRNNQIFRRNDQGPRPYSGKEGSLIKSIFSNSARSGSQITRLLKGIFSSGTPGTLSFGGRDLSSSGASTLRGLPSRGIDRTSMHSAVAIFECSHRHHCRCHHSSSCCYCCCCCCAHSCRCSCR
jgi:hypothetical protein